MKRPITLFTAQWADLPFSDICAKAAEFGFDGLELCTWGDHFNAKKAATNSNYCDAHGEILRKYGLGCWAIGSHIVGQLVGDNADPRNNAFAPKHLADKPEEIRKWAIDEMIAIAHGAKAFGVETITGFMGSPIWHAFYSFPPTTAAMVEGGFERIVALWSPIFDEFDKAGVRFALEVHPSEIAYDFYTTVKLLAAFNNRRTLGINFDPSHLVWQGLNCSLFFRDMAKHILHVHLKDAKIRLDGHSSVICSHLPFGDLRRGWDFVSLGHGNVDFDSIIREANAASYGGPLSIEWEDNGMDRDFGAKESLAFARKISFAPSDVAFERRMEK